MDQFTYGNTPAAVILVKALSELDSKPTTAKVSRFLVALCTRLKSFHDSNLPVADKLWAMNLAHDKFKRSVNNTTSTLPLPKTLMLNVGKMHVQEYIKAAKEKAV